MPFFYLSKYYIHVPLKQLQTYFNNYVYVFISLSYYMVYKIAFAGKPVQKILSETLTLYFSLSKF